MLKQEVQRSQNSEGDSRNNCQVGDLHRIIKVIGHGIMHTLCLCLCGIHPLVCMVTPELFILILGVDLYIMKGCQIILLIDDREPKYLFWLCMLLWMNSYGQYFDITLSVKYSRWILVTIALFKRPHEIYFDGFKARGAWYMHFDLLHGCDNMISRLANKAKVLA